MRKGNCKYMTGSDQGQAVEAAEQYFGRPKEELLIEVVREGNEMFPWLVFAISPDAQQTDAKDRNGSFCLYYEEDGVYLELYPPKGNGTPCNRNEMASYLQRKSIHSMNLSAALSMMGKGWGREQVAPPQEELLLGEDIVVIVAGNAMSAEIRIMAPDEGGAPATEDGVRAMLAAAGVVHGISDEAIAAALAEKTYNKGYHVAQATEPVPGEDARLEFHFVTEKHKLAPKHADDDAKVDYRELNLFEPVKEGQLLVTKIPAMEGMPGTTVKGDEIKAKLGKDIPLPKSKNVVVNEEKTAMYAQKTGMVEYIGGTVIVADIYEVKGDCDMTVGNIDFDGSVDIKGNVITGIVIKATGSISVGGVIEGAELSAGGDILLKRGMQGIDKGKISAGGSITAVFIERAHVVAGGTVTADVVIHSTIEAGDSLFLKGKRASIMGGTARVTNLLVAKTVGAVVHTQTEIEVGLAPHKRVRLQFLTKEKKRLQEAAEKLEQLSTYLSQAQSKVPEAGREKLRATMQENILQNTQQLQECTEELSVLEYEAEHADDGKVHVLGMVYPGTKIAIAKGIYKVNQPISYATFRFKDGEVGFVACEYRE